MAPQLGFPLNPSDVAWFVNTKVVTGYKDTPAVFSYDPEDLSVPFPSVGNKFSIFIVKLQTLCTQLSIYVHLSLLDVAVMGKVSNYILNW